MNEPKDYIGHRQRIKERFLRGRGRDMADYEFLELLLTLAIPRKDTKPLAKALINEFGSFAAAVSADDERLMSFSGLKENSVLLFAIVREAALRMAWQNLCAADKPVISNWDAMVDFCRMKMAYKKREEFMLILLDAKLQVIGEEIQQAARWIMLPSILRKLSNRQFSMPPRVLSWYITTRRATLRRQSRIF